MSTCVCGSGLAFALCCEPILNGKPAPTAEALMRSRYAAYALGKLDHVERTATPEALEGFNRQDSERVVDESKWLGLEILRTVDGGEGDQTGQVEFVFRYSLRGQTYAQHELSTFCRKDGAWLYSSSEINPKSPPVRVTKEGRNDPCACGSGKKHKKCCGA